MQDFVSLGLSPVARDHADVETILRLSSCRARSDRCSPHLPIRCWRGDRTARGSVRRSRSRAAIGTWSAGTTSAARCGPSGWTGCLRPRPRRRPSSARRTSMRSRMFDRRLARPCTGLGARWCWRSLPTRRHGASRRRTARSSRPRTAPCCVSAPTTLTGPRRILASLECDLVVLRPPELRTSLRMIASALAGGRTPPATSDESGFARHVVRQPLHARHTSGWCPAMSLDQTRAMTFSAIAVHPTAESARTVR